MILAPILDGCEPLPARGEEYYCRVCGLVEPKNAPNQRHCSRECRKEADRRRAAARHKKLNRRAHHRQAA